jgi:hypothetical protein
MRHTAFLARLLGLFTLIVAVSIGLHRTQTLLTVGMMVQSAPLMMVLGFIGLAAGLAMVLAHNVWKGGLLPVIVTLAGWVILLRGVVILALPHPAMVELVDAVHYQQLFYVYIAVAIVIGAYLTFAGFSARDNS